MATVTFKGKAVQTIGDLPCVGDFCADFSLCQTDLSDFDSKLSNCRLILNIFPSLDTPVCANSVREFNRYAAGLSNAKLLCVSADLPFAHSRFCESEGIQNAINLSCFRNPEFGERLGLRLQDGPLRGLLTRAIIILDEKHQVEYLQLVPEITEEPNYEDVYSAC